MTAAPHVITPLLARSTTSGSPLYLNGSQYYATSSGVNDVEPVALACKFKSNEIGVAAQTMLSLHRNVTATEFFRIGTRGSGNLDLLAQNRSGGENEFANPGSLTLVAEQWHIGIAAFDSNTHRTTALDGQGYVTPDTDTVTVANTDRITVGVNSESGTIKDGFAGYIEWVCLWSLDMEEGDAANIGGGSNPLNVQNSDITFYQNFLEGINGPSSLGPALGGLLTF